MIILMYFSVSPKFFTLGNIPICSSGLCVYCRRGGGRVSVCEKELIKTRYMVVMNEIPCICTLHLKKHFARVKVM